MKSSLSLLTTSIWEREEGDEMPFESSLPPNRNPKPYSICHLTTHLIEFSDEDHARGVLYCRAEFQMGKSGLCSRFNIGTVMSDEKERGTSEAVSTCCGMART